MNIEVEVSIDGLIDGIKSLEELEKWFNQKADEMCEELAQEIKQYSQSSYNVALNPSGEALAPVKVRVEKPRDGERTVIAEGEDVLWIEYGTGVFYNGTEPYPIARPSGIVGIGEYGEGKGKRQQWGYRDVSGTKLTHGIPASKSMYLGTRTGIVHLERIKRKVFK